MWVFFEECINVWVRQRSNGFDKWSNILKKWSLEFYKWPDCYRLFINRYCFKLRIRHRRRKRVSCIKLQFIRYASIQSLPAVNLEGNYPDSSRGIVPVLWCPKGKGEAVFCITFIEGSDNRMSALKQKKKKEEIGRRKKESRWKVDTKTLTGSGKRERECRANCVEGETNEKLDFN